MKIAVKKFRLALIGSLAILFISGCQQKPDMYHWGSYEQLIHDMYIEAGSAEPQTQILSLNTDIQYAAEHGLKTPPGVYAHLGFMYAANGEMQMAMASFEEEKKLFPESAKFIDGMIKRAMKDKK